MVGAVTDSTAKIFVRTHEEATAIKIQYKTTADPWPGMSTSGINADGDTDFTAVFSISGLNADTAYDYRVLFNTVIDFTTVATFTTFPAEDSAVNFTFSFSGDMGGGSARPYTSFANIPADAKFHIMLGDNIYADQAPVAATLEDFLNRYYMDAKVNKMDSTWDDADFKSFSAGRPVYKLLDSHYVRGGWDKKKADPYPAARKAAYLYQFASNPDSPDNDTGTCGPGTTGTTIKDVGAFSNAEAGDPLYNITQNKITHITSVTSNDEVQVNDSGYFAAGDTFVVPHAYSSWKYGDIEFFAIDNTSYRDNQYDADSANKTILGKRQKRWLKNAVKDSTATWKILLTGGPMSTVSGNAWGWQNYEYEMAELWDYWFANNAHNGIVVLSAHLHQAAAWKMLGTSPLAVDFDTPWFYEFSISPIASVVLAHDYNTGDRLWKYAKTSTNYFATMEIDTTIGNPTAIVRVYEKDGTLRHTEIVYLSTANGPSD